MSAKNKNPEKTQYDSSYDGKYVHLPILDRFQSGDILLTKNKNSKSIIDKTKSSLIAKSTNGEFSHALICSVPPVFVEAIQDGVSTLSLQNCFAHSLENIRVLRHPDSTVAEKSGKKSMMYIGEDYSKILAALSISSIKPPFEFDGIFCSFLIAECYKYSEEKNFITLDTKKITPASLEKMTFLNNVTDVCFSKNLAPLNIEAMSALDGDRKKSPVSKQALIHNNIYKNSKIYLNLISSKIPYVKDNYPKTFSEVMSMMQSLYDFCIQQNDSELFSIYHDLDNCILNSMINYKLMDIVQEACEQGELELSRIEIESQKEHGDVALTDLLQMLKPAKDQLKQRQDSVNTFRKDGKIKCLEFYIMIQNNIINTSKLRIKTLEKSIQLLKTKIGNNIRI